NYPNPFNPSTKIKYQIATSNPVSLKIYDVLGNEVASLIDEIQPSGNYEITFDARSLSSGTYFYKLQAGDFIETKKLLLIK
ncbi:MAG: T9SS type A sorting domain-containing protein, partial [Saprospiraceae bacterium]